MTASSPKGTAGSARLWQKQVMALIAKEFAQIVRDPSSYMIAVLLPALFLFLFGYGISLDQSLLRIGILDESKTQSSTALVADFSASPWFRVQPCNSMEEVNLAMRSSAIQGFVRIREDYERSLALLSAQQRQHMGSGGVVLAEARATREIPATLQLVVDGTEPNSASFLQAYAQSVIQGHIRGLLQEKNIVLPQIGVQERFWYNPSAKSVNFLVPGSITVIMTLIGTLLTSLVFAREWERGTMEAMLATPVTRLQLILGKLIPYFALGMFSLILCTVLAILVFDVPFRGSYLALFFISSIFMLCALGQGLLISVHMKGQLVAAEAGLFSGFLPALLLSGFIFDVSSMPPILQWLSELLPATHFNLCIRTLFLAGTIPSVLVPETICLAGLAALLMLLVYKGLKKSIE